jgi:hypothetical protein
MWNFPIDKNNIVRHSDVTQDINITKQRILRDWNRLVKKRDIWLPFFVDNLHFRKWRDQLVARKESRFKS